MQAVVEIQKRLPNARVLYVSATGATEAENLCYMTRLGLWGDKTAFRNKLDFVSMLQQRGVGELLKPHECFIKHLHRLQKWHLSNEAVASITRKSDPELTLFSITVR